MIPNQAEWMQHNDSIDLSVIGVGKRERQFVMWEPFYISNNEEPWFDERINWEGQSDKRVQVELKKNNFNNNFDFTYIFLQNYAMCLLGYEYHILHPAFLVHKPGIKESIEWQSAYVQLMNSLIENVIVPEYKIIYGHNDNCAV